MSETHRSSSPDFRRRRSQSHPNYQLPHLRQENNDELIDLNKDGRFKRKKWDLSQIKLLPAISPKEKEKKPHRFLRSATSTSDISMLNNDSIRTVPAFTTASRMKNVKVKGPPKLGVFKPRPSPPTTFRKMYERGDIPVTLHHNHRGHSLRWKVDLEKLDYHHFLPLFFDGLRETAHPYDFFSRAGVTDLLSRGGDKILPVVPQLILPLKSALNTKDPRVICTVLHVIQELVSSSPHIGEALVPFYRQLLPTLNLFKNKNANIGDEIDYSQHRQENLGDLIQETLEMLERRGGKDAYINIKYMVPTYQSCIM